MHDFYHRPQEARRFLWPNQGTEVGKFKVWQAGLSAADSIVYYRPEVDRTWVYGAYVYIYRYTCVCRYVCMYACIPRVLSDLLQDGSTLDNHNLHAERT